MNTHLPARLILSLLAADYLSILVLLATLSHLLGKLLH